MSIKFMNWAFEQEVEPLARFLLVTLADFANAEGVAWPSRKTLEERTGMGRSTIRRQLRQLEDQGLIRTVSSETETGANGSNRYVLVASGGLGPERTHRGSGVGPERTKDGAGAAQAINRTEPPEEPEERTIPPIPPTGGGECEAHPAECDSFESFRAAWPAGAWSAHGRAVREWRRLGPDPGLVAMILAAVERQARSARWTREGGRFIPRPDRWLRDRAWLDDLSPATVGETPDMFSTSGPFAAADPGPELPPLVWEPAEWPEWEAAREGLEAEIDATSFRTWIMPLHPVVDGKGVALAAPSAFMARWVASNYQDRIERLLCAPVRLVVGEVAGVPAGG